MMPTTIAAIVKTTSWSHGTAKTISSTRKARSPPRSEAEGDTQGSADERRHHALVPDHPPHLAPRHPDCSQHSELAGALIHREDERVDDPEEADDDGECEEHVDDVQDGGEPSDLVVLELLSRLRFRVGEVLQAPL